MLKRTEAQAIAAAVDRLTERFPDEPRSVVEDVVAEEYSVLDGCRVRDYVAILVERGARRRLVRRQLSADFASVPGGSPGAA